MTSEILHNMLVFASYDLHFESRISHSRRTIHKRRALFIWKHDTTGLVFQRWGSWKVFLWSRATQGTEKYHKSSAVVTASRKALQIKVNKLKENFITHYTEPLIQLYSPANWSVVARDSSFDSIKTKLSRVRLPRIHCTYLHFGYHLLKAAVFVLQMLQVWRYISPHKHFTTL